jgi:integrase/recombinase XerC
MNKEMLIKDYMEYLNALGKSKETQRSYKTCVNRFFNDTQFEVVEEMADLNSLWFLDYANSLREQLSVPTINKHIKQLSSLYQYLIVKGIAKVNPCFRLPSLSNSDNEYKEKVMSDEQAKAILKATDSFKQYDFKNALRDKSLIFLLMNCGLRIGELSRVRVADIDLENNKIWIRGKGHNDNISRYSNFNNITKGLLAQLMQQNSNKEYLFTNYKGEKLSEGSIRKIWYRACEIANVLNITPHNVRHYIGSSLVEKGVELKKVAQALGHSSYKTTEKYYVKQKESIADVIDVIDIF